MDSFSSAFFWFALLAPLGGCIVTSLTPAGSTRFSGAAAITGLLLSFAGACLLMLAQWNLPPVSITIPWIEFGNGRIPVELLISNQALIMLVVVSFVSLMVHVYSSAYMRGDEGWKRYFALLAFFTFAMQGIVVSDNLLVLFAFWELVGFSSYMLIGHWNKKATSGAAATKAFVLNRIGDVGFLVGLLIIWATCHSFSLSEIFSGAFEGGWQTAAALCLFAGVAGKSAQVPLFPWLADAMEGPTPVSALIHAATMVAAGVYLLIRLFPLFTETALTVVAVVGMITTLAGALAALAQYDIKKILAYSTMSQLGLMVLMVGMGVTDAAFLHLLTHAFFKACLFLSAGMVIHAVGHALPHGVHFDAQDIRNLGGLRKRLPVAFLTFMLGGASLAGVPFFSGFLSKEAMLTALFVHDNVLSWLMMAVVLGVSFLTVLYTFRLIWFLFFGNARTVRMLDVGDPSVWMRLPAMLLAGCSLWLVVSWNPFNFKGWMLEPGPAWPYSMWITLLSVTWIAVALVTAWYLYPRREFRTHPLLRNAFYVDKAYLLVTSAFTRVNASATTWMEQRVIDPVLHSMAYGQVMIAHVTGWVDRTLVDGTVNTVARMTGWAGKFTRSFQGGNIQLYVFWSALTVIIFIIWALN